MPRLQIRNATVVTLNPAGEVLADGTVCVEDGTLTYVGAGAGAPLPEPDCEILSLPDHLLLPGLVNAHTHLPMSLFRGLADDLPLQEWLEDHIFPAEAAFVDAATVGPAVRLSVAEMLLSGTTCCADGYFLEEHVLRAAADMGIRGVFAHGVIDSRAPGLADPACRMDVLRRFLEAARGASPQGRAVFAHSPYTCSAETLREAKALAREHDCRFFIHVAETAQEREESLARHHGQSPVRYLDALGILDAATVLVHAVHVDEADCDLIADRGAAVVVNTESNMKLAAGVAPVTEFLARGIAVALGTDSPASNNDLDMFSEMALTAKLQKVKTGDPAALPAETVLRMATNGGAAVLGLTDQVGSVEKGKRADLIAVRTDLPHATPLYDPVSHLVYSAGGADVDTVMVDGRLLVREGRLQHAAIAEIRSHVCDIAEGIRRASRPGARSRLAPGSPAPGRQPRPRPGSCGGESR